MGGGGGMTEYWGGTIHFFLLTLYNFKNIGGGVVVSCCRTVVFHLTVYLVS